MNPEYARKSPTAKAGLFATLVASLRAAGSAAPSSGLDRGGRTSSLRLIGLAVVVAAALLSVFASSALAARGHVYDESLVIGEPCTVEPCAPGTLKEPSGVAVNEATGVVYVVDKALNRVEMFDGQSGASLGQFDGSETPAGSFEAPEGIAVDNACHLQAKTGSECESFDPSNGDVYVVDAGSAHRVIDKFSAGGTYLGQITEGNGIEFSSFLLAGVAVDPQGKLWVYREQFEINGFSNAEPNAFEKAIGITGFRLPGPGFAVDSKGNFYVHRNNGQGNHQISKLSPSGSVLIEEVGEAEASAVSVDQSTDSSFIDNLTSVGVFNPSGVEVERFDFGGDLIKGAGIGVNAATGFAYVADAAAGHLLVLGPTVPAAPLISATAASTVSSADATLEAEVNPQSEPEEGPTTYFFEYGPCAAGIATCESSPYGHSTAAATLAPDFEVHPVSLQVSGLAPATAYHFRAVASNDKGPTAGDEGTFTTQTTGTLPLPDSRQWEMVSPPAKLGARIQPISESGVVQAAAGGGAITYLTSSPASAEPEGYDNEAQILSRRTAAGWSTRDIGIPHSSETGKTVGSGPEYKFFNPELTLSAVQPYGQFNPALSPEASESTAFLHDLGGACGSSCYRPFVTGKAGFANVPAGTVFGEAERCTKAVGQSVVSLCGPEFLGATEDLSHVVLRAEAELKPGAGKGQLYEWSGGTLAQVSILPGGEPTPDRASFFIHASIFTDGSARRAISDDGNRIVFSTTAGALYQRDMSRGKTIQLDAAACEACESGGGQFQIASADGSRAFFTSPRRLTADSGAATNKLDLYECRIVIDGEGTLHCDLTDLTPEQDEEAAAVQGGVLGASEDGSYIYFVANGVLTSTPNARGQQAQEGTCEGSPPPLSARCNLYLDHDGVTSFITTLGGGDRTDWGEALLGQPTRVTANGRYLELMSELRLTGYDNRDVATGQPAAEVYLYDASTARLSCASCDPTGARPVGVEYHQLEPGSNGLVGGPTGVWVPTSLVAANVPGWTAIASGAQTKNRYQPRYLSDSGRLFFNTANGLVPGDSNNTQDVYQYESPGVGDCTTAIPTYSSTSGGCVSLISAGTSGLESAFLDASESGDDVFFLTYSRLVPEDVDSALDVYDAHACSAAVPCLPSPPPPAPACEGDACQQPAVPPDFESPGTALIDGPENVLECPKGKVKKSGKCVAKHHKKKHKGKKHHKRAAGHKRGGQK